MTPDEIPDELIEILDRRAGKKHSRTGRVLNTLAEILTRYEQLRSTPTDDNNPKESS